MMKLLGSLKVVWDWFLNWLISLLTGRQYTRYIEIKEKLSVPVELIDNHLYVHAECAQLQPLSFILDTGADSNAVNSRLIDEFNLTQKIEIAVDNVGTGEGKPKIALTRNTWFSLKGIPFRVNIFAPLGVMEDLVGRRIDGVLGAEIFYRAVVEINYKTRMITLYNPDTYLYTGHGEVIDIALAGRRPFVQAGIKMPGLNVIEGRFLIDTGDSSALSLHSPFVARHNLLSSCERLIPHFTHGLAGASKEFLGRIETFNIGSILFRRPVMAFSQAERGSKANKEYDGAIGGEILRRFKTIFDYSRKRMILERNEDFDQPFETDMSGLSLICEGEERQAISVDRITENSPASQIGLQAGDKILEIDGLAAKDLGLSRIKNLFYQNGKEYKMEILRDVRTFQVIMNTRRLV